MRATDKELAMYGMSEADIREDYMESLTARHCGIDRIRKQLNVAKFILFTTKETA
jgi:hypothetical protein